MKPEHFGNDYLEALETIETLQEAVRVQSEEIARLRRFVEGVLSLTSGNELPNDYKVNYLQQEAQEMLAE